MHEYELDDETLQKAQLEPHKIFQNFLTSPALAASGEGNGTPLQYSCLESPMNRGAWRATVHGVTRVGHDLATKQLKGYIGDSGKY